MFERAKIQKPGIADEPWYDSIALLNAYELLHRVSFPHAPTSCLRVICRLHPGAATVAVLNANGASPLNSLKVSNCTQVATTRPPAARMTSPVVQADSSDARNTANGAISLTRPSRRAASYRPERRRRRPQKSPRLYCLRFPYDREQSR